MNDILKDRICDAISQGVQNGAYAQGAKLSEEKIASELKVSRTPVREALQHLSSLGYVEKIPRRGFFVKRWTKEEKADVFEVISVFDFMCARKAVGSMTELDYKKLREYIAKMSLAIAFENYSDYVDNQRLFHNYYIDKCNNPILIKTIRSLMNNPMQVTYSSESNDPDMFKLFQHNNEEHERIVECMEKKDFALLQRLIVNHWTNFDEKFV